MKALWITLVLIVLIGVSIVAFTFYPRPSQAKEANVCLHLSDYNNQTIFYLKELGVTWVRTDWMMTTDKSMQTYSQDLQNSNINLLTIIDINTFNHQNFSLEEWNTTLTEIVASEYFDTVDAVEIWNEPNALAYIDSETYYEMLKSAYVIIKNYTSVEVVFAGVSPNVDGWENYLEEIFVHQDIGEYFDYMGIHLYDGTQTNFETLNFVNGLTSKPIWVTETGKPSIDSETEQAQYLGVIYETITPKVGKIFIYELNDGQGAEPPKENYFGLLTIDGSRKEAYYVVENISKG